MVSQGRDPSGDAAITTQEELLTAQFYDWEKRGRGWRFWGRPVGLEPPFRPFFYHLVTLAGPLPDDARKPTLLGGLIEKMRARLADDAVKPPWPQALPEPEDPEPTDASDDDAVAELQLSIPPTLKVTRDAAEQFLLSLPPSAGPLAFELIGDERAVTTQVACRESDLPDLRQQLQGYFPEPVLGESRGFLLDKWDRSGGRETVVVDFGLHREFMLPLKAFKGFEVDPLTGVVSALSDLRQGELGVLQILFQPAVQPWAESILRAVSDWDGDSFFIDAPELLPLAREKVSRPVFAVVIRAAAQSPDYGRAWQIVRNLSGALRQLSNPSGNEFMPLDNEGYEDDDHQEDVVLRRTQRSGMLLNSEELVSLVHLPSASVRVAKLVREETKTRAAPPVSVARGLVLGENRHAGKTIQVALAPEQRVRHTYVIGASGTGKSTLLLNMIVQDIRNGQGFAVLDPHGDLIDQVLGHVPEERHRDVVLLDPADAEWPIGFNILQAHSEVEKNLMASDLVAVFRRLSTSWGDQMTSVLGNAVLAFLESDRGGTLADLRRFLVEPEFRRTFLASVRDREIVYYWQKEFPLLAGKPQAPILTRLDTFLRPRLVRHMVAQRENRLDFRAMMDTGKIFLAKLAQGAIGEENAYLLGTLLVSKFQQVAMSRQEIEETARRPFFLYIDEFQNFVTPSMAAILSGARKYRLGLVLAHQDLRQLSRDPDTYGAVMSNPYTRICFRVGDEDARKLQEGFASFEAKDLQNLGTGEAICRLERAEYDFNVKTPPLPASDAAVARATRERVTALSREKYATRRVEVEAALSSERAEEPTPEPQSEPTPTRPPEPKREVRAPVTTAASRPAALRDLAPSPPQASSSPGRGGQRHKYLQELIKRWAESRGYRATIEKQVLDGLGSVDVALEKGELSVACEISVTTTPEHELDNVHKCLAAGFGHVVMVSAERKTLSKAKDLVSEGLSEIDKARLRFLTPEELFAFLEEVEARAAGTEDTVRGYRVRVRYRPVVEEDKRTRRQAISKVILGAVRRLRGKGEAPDIRGS